DSTSWRKSKIAVPVPAYVAVTKPLVKRRRLRCTVMSAPPPPESFATMPTPRNSGSKPSAAVRVRLRACIATPSVIGVLVAISMRSPSAAASMQACSVPVQPGSPGQVRVAASAVAGRAAASRVANRILRDMRGSARVHPWVDDHARRTTAAFQDIADSGARPLPGFGGGPRERRRYMGQRVDRCARLVAAGSGAGAIAGGGEAAAFAEPCPGEIAAQRGTAAREVHGRCGERAGVAFAARGCDLRGDQAQLAQARMAGRERFDAGGECRVGL